MSDKGFHLSIDTSDLISALSKLGKVAEKVAGPILVSEAELLMTKAKMLTPVDTGALRASGHVQAPVVEGGKVSVTLGFGGAAEAYAVPVHERMDVHHPVGQAKFLETPVREWESDGVKRLADRLASAMKGV